MKALTVQQPWAWAIVHGGKDVENRTQAWSHRGPLAIHAGLATDRAGMRDPRFTAAFTGGMDGTRSLEALATVVGGPLVHGAFIGVVDLVDVHHSYTCPECSPWGDYEPSKVHLVLENPRPLAQPIPAKGRLGLWTPTPEVLEQLAAIA